MLVSYYSVLINSSCLCLSTCLHSRIYFRISRKYPRICYILYRLWQDKRLTALTVMNRAVRRMTRPGKGYLFNLSTNATFTYFSMRGIAAINLIKMLTVLTLKPGRDAVVEGDFLITF